MDIVLNLQYMYIYIYIYIYIARLPERCYLPRKNILIRVMKYPGKHCIYIYIYIQCLPGYFITLICIYIYIYIYTVSTWIFHNPNLYVFLGKLHRSGKRAMQCAHIIQRRYACRKLYVMKISKYGMIVQSYTSLPNGEGYVFISVGLQVCVFVYLLATLRENAWTEFSWNCQDMLFKK